MKKKWIAGIVTGVVLLILAAFGVLAYIYMTGVVKYGTPQYRPRVE
jgi:hypothetical protein